MVEIEIGGRSAVIRSLEWHSAAPSLQQLLRDDVAVRPAPSQYEPWPDMAIAQEAVTRYGGRIVRQVAPAFDRNRIY